MIRIIFSLLIGVASLTATARAADPVELSDTAPDSYTVKKGDTLWDISGMFLKKPWRWPEVWRMNRNQIRNPHLIYPGQVIVLDRNGPSLSIGRTVRDKLSPQVHSEALDSAIPSIPPEAIEPFLTKPLVVDSERLAKSGTVIATQEGRLYTGRGDLIFAKDIPEGQKDWLVYRPVRPVLDPDTKEVLGYEAAYLGSAVVETNGRPATLRVAAAQEEIGKGDRLVAAEEPKLMAYMPHAPQNEITGKVAAIYGGVAETGPGNVVTLNVGANAGLEPGDVLALARDRGAVQNKNEETGDDETFQLPEQRYGLLFVFRVFDRIAYGLVMESEDSTTIGDIVHNP